MEYKQWEIFLSQFQCVLLIILNQLLINLFSATTAKTAQGLLSQSVNVLAYTLFTQNVNYYELGI